jgi:hypothetical protein
MQIGFWPMINRPAGFLAPRAHLIYTRFNLFQRSGKFTQFGNEFRMVINALKTTMDAPYAHSGTIYLPDLIGPAYSASSWTVVGRSRGFGLVIPLNCRYRRPDWPLYKWPPIPKQNERHAKFVEMSKYRNVSFRLHFVFSTSSPANMRLIWFFPGFIPFYIKIAFGRRRLQRNSLWCYDDVWWCAPEFFSGSGTPEWCSM